MQTVGYAALQVIPSMKGVKGGIESGLNGSLGAAGTKGGKRWGGGFVGSVAKYAKRATGIMAAVATAGAVKGGWDRALNIDAARGKLKGLGHDAKSVDTIMTSALVSVKGTAYGLDAAATTAAGAVAAGVKPGKELTKYLSLTSDAASIAGVSMTEMGSIFNKVQTQQRAYTMELNMLADRGIPIYQWLQKEYGVTATELRKMVAAGEVDAATYKKVIDANIGGAAKSSGDTIRGTLANVGASFSRLGASVIDKALPTIKTGLDGIIGGVDSLTARVGPGIDAFKARVSGAFDNLNIGSGLQNILAGGTFDGAALGQSLADAIGSAFDTLADMGSTLADKVGAMFAKVDWIGLGIELGRTAIPLILGLATGIINSITEPALWQGIWNHLPAILLAAVSVAFMPAKWAMQLTKWLSKIPLVGKMLGWVVTNLNKLGGKFLSFGKDLLGWFFGGLRNGLGLGGPAFAVRLFKWAQSLFPRLKAWGTSMAARGADAMRAMFLRMGEAVGSGIVRVGRAMGRIHGAIVEKVRGAGTWLLSVGTDIMNGLLRGIDRGLGWVRSKVSGIGRAIPGWLKKVLGIASPSKVTRKLGVWVTRGLALGIFDGVGFARATTRRTATRVMQGMTAATLKHAKRTIIAATQVGNLVGNALSRGVIKTMPKTAAAIDKWDASTNKKFKASRKRLLASMQADARDRYQALKAQMTEYASAVRDGATQMAGLANFTPEEGVALSANSMIGYLGDQVAKIQSFGANLANASRKGLSKGLYDQIVQMGPEQGAAYAAALAQATPAQIKAMNKQQASIHNAAARLGAQTSRTMYGAGVDAAAGFVRGMNQMVGRIRKMGSTMGKAVVRSLKKALGIRSPSRVMAAEIGRHLLPGVYRGVKPTQARFDREMAASVNPTRWAGSVASARVASSIADTRDVVTGHSFPTAEEIADALDKRPVNLTIGGRRFAEVVQDANNEIRRLE